MTKEQLKALREETGMKQTEVAKALGMDRKVVNRLERGRVKILNESAEKLINFYKSKK